ncbi:MAG: HAD-IA family hydrolase [Deltaproteobacteria bacterium]
MRVECAAVLFDLDGVLVDSTAYIERQWQDWALSRGLDPGPFLRVCHGRRAVETIRLAAPELDADAEVARFRPQAPDEDAVLPPLPGAHRLLAALSPVPWAVVTSGARRFALARLAGADLPAPPVLVSAEDVRQGKPSPEGYLRAAELVGVAARDCVAFEDAPPGIAAARAAGATVIAVATTHPPDALVEAHAVAGSLADVHLAFHGPGRPALEIALLPLMPV